MKKRALTLFLSIFFIIGFSCAQTAQTKEAKLTSATAGQVLADGTVYKVESNLTINGTYANKNALEVAAGAATTICIAKGCTLTVKGYDAVEKTGAGAGIYVPQGATLYITGEGILNATGGNAANGGDGANGENGDPEGNGKGIKDAPFTITSSSWTNGSFSSGKGGTGGFGGGGAGAAIGGAGGLGPDGGIGGTSVKTTFQWILITTTRTADDGKPGSNGTNGGNGISAGSVYILGNVSVNAQPGISGAKGGNVGQRGYYGFIKTGIGDNIGAQYVAGAGGGGAGGGAGFAAVYSIGGGGASGGSGAGGGSGAADYSTNKDAISAKNATCYASSAIGFGIGASNGTGGTDASTRDEGEVSGTFPKTGGIGGTQGGAAGNPGNNGTLTVKSSANVLDGATTHRNPDNTLSGVNEVPTQLNTSITLDLRGGSGYTGETTFTWKVGEKFEALTPPMPARSGYNFVGFYTEPNGGGKKVFNSDGTSSYCCDFVQSQVLYAHWVIYDYRVTWSYDYADAETGADMVIPDADRSTYAKLTIKDNAGNELLSFNVHSGEASSGSANEAQSLVYLHPGTTTDTSHSTDLGEASVIIAESLYEKIVSFEVTPEGMSSEYDGKLKVAYPAANSAKIFYAPGRYDARWEITLGNTIDQEKWPKAIYVKLLWGTTDAGATTVMPEFASENIRCELNGGKYVADYPVKMYYDDTKTQIAHYKVKIVGVDNNGKESDFTSKNWVSSETMYWIDANNAPNREIIHYNLTLPVVKMDANGGQLVGTPEYAWENSISTDDGYSAQLAGCQFLGWNESETATTATTLPYNISGENKTLYAVWKDVEAPTISFGGLNKSNYNQAYTITDNKSGVNTTRNNYPSYKIFTSKQTDSSVNSWSSNSTPPSGWTSLNTNTSGNISLNSYKGNSVVYVYIWAKDVAGNVNVQYKEVHVDDESPVITTTPYIATQNGVKVICYEPYLEVEVTVTDAHLKTVTVKGDDGSVINPTSGASSTTEKTYTLNFDQSKTVTYTIEATDEAGNPKSTEYIRMESEHIWSTEYQEKEPTANEAGYVAFKICLNCNRIALLKNGTLVDLTDPEDLKKLVVPAGAILIKCVDGNHNEILAYETYINDAIVLAAENDDYPSTSGGTVKSNTVKLTGPSHMDKDDSDRAFSSVSKSIILDLNGNSIEDFDGNAYSTITGNSNVTILLSDGNNRGQVDGHTKEYASDIIPYANKSPISAASPIKYTRKFSAIQAGKWQALFLPVGFTVPSSGANYVVATLDTEKTITIPQEAGSKYVLSVTQTTTVEANKPTQITTVEANKPYWIKTNESEGVVPIEISLTPGLPAAKAWVTDAQTVDGKFTFSGGTQLDSPASDGANPFWVMLNNGTMWWAAAGQTQRPYRWVIQPSGNGAKTFSFEVVESDATDIDDAIKTIDNGPHGIYTLDGRKLPSATNLHPGIYIIDGKKVVIK